MTDSAHFPDEIPEEIRKTFLGVLADDVVLLMDQLDHQDSQATRRNLIRAMFAAIEGLTRVYRDSVRSVAEDIEPFDALTDMALSAASYNVSDTGKLQKQTRYIPLPAMIRLITRLAAQVSSDLKVDFSGSSWKNFRKAVGVRNRITHPKTETDLVISDEDLTVVRSAFFWLFQLVEDATRAMTNEASRYFKLLTAFTDQLLAGDPQALALYEAAKRELDD